MSPLHAQVNIPKLKFKQKAGATMPKVNKLGRNVNQKENITNESQYFSARNRSVQEEFAVKNQEAEKLQDGFYATFSKHGSIAGAEAPFNRSRQFDTTFGLCKSGLRYASQADFSAQKGPESKRVNPEILITPLNNESDEDSDLSRSLSEIQTKISAIPSIGNLSELGTPFRIEKITHSDNEASKKNATKKLKMFRKGSIKFFNKKKDNRISVRAASPSTKEIADSGEVFNSLEATGSQARNAIRGFDGSKRVLLTHSKEKERSMM